MSYMCVCNAVTDEEVLAAIKEGADTISAVTAKCGAGGCCGACHQHIRSLIKVHTKVQDDKRRTVGSD